MKGNGRRFYAASVAVVIVALLSLVFPSPTLAAESLASPAGGTLAHDGFNCTHIVHFGGTLSAIAARYGTSVFALMQANSIANPNRIFAGMLLRVPCLPAVARARTIYTVRPGDDLLRIGLRFGVNYLAIARFNGLRNPNLIFAGMRLAIPLTGYTAPAYAPSYSPGYMPPQAPGYSPGYPQAMPPPGGGMPPSSGGQTVNASIQDFSFSPNPINIRVGQMVVWRNNGPSPHTATSDSGVWNSGTLNPGAMFAFTFNSPGTFTYHCDFHPAMRGTVVVAP